LNKLSNWLERFARSHPKFAIPNLMTIIAVGSALVYLLDGFSGGVSLSGLLAFSPYAILHGQVWRLVTFVFVPLGGGFLTLVSLYFYWWIGSALEREWGSAKFTVYYAAGILLNVIVGFVLYFAMSPAFAGSARAYLITANTQYLNLSLFFSFATLYPDMQVLLLFIIPVKVKWLAWVDAAIFAWGVLSSLLSLNPVGAVLPVVAILNYLLFFWGDLMDVLGRTRSRVRHQTSSQTINFKKATRQAQQTRGYLHKCAVCGKTDTDFPNEEFRYCSKCNGYYCYCSEHIHNHEHIQ